MQTIISLNPNQGFILTCVTLGLGKPDKSQTTDATSGTEPQHHCQWHSTTATPSTEITAVTPKLHS